MANDNLRFGRRGEQITADQWNRHVAILKQLSAPSNGYVDATGVLIRPQSDRINPWVELEIGSIIEDDDYSTTHLRRIFWKYSTGSMPADQLARFVDLGKENYDECWLTFQHTGKVLIEAELCAEFHDVIGDRTYDSRLECRQPWDNGFGPYVTGPPSFLVLTGVMDPNINGGSPINLVYTNDPEPILGYLIRVYDPDKDWQYCSLEAKSRDGGPTVIPGMPDVIVTVHHRPSFSGTYYQPPWPHNSCFRTVQVNKVGQQFVTRLTESRLQDRASQLFWSEPEVHETRTRLRLEWQPGS